MAKILIIDDERMVRHTLRKVLEKQNHTVFEAQNGQAGMDVFDSTPGIDLVMTDLIMPDMEGFQTIRKLRQTSPETRIIAMSGSGRTNNKDYLQAALQSGATVAMQKPFSVDDILKTVDQCLK